MITKQNSFIKRFWSKVNKISANDCWIWTGAPRPRGYGEIMQGGRGSKLLLAHRASWIIHNGPIPDNLCVLHNCPNGDNPSCVNPKHLWLGDRVQNLQDMRNKGRQSEVSLFYNGRIPPHRKLTDDQIIQVRELLKLGKKLKEIADLFNVPKHVIFDIKRGRTLNKAIIDETKDSSNDSDTRSIDNSN